LYTELRKRHVLEIALVYLGVAWLFIEITQFVVGNYGFSRKALDAVFLIAALGFPAFLVIAWYHGEKGPQEMRRGEASLLVTLAVLGAIGTYRIATGEEVPLEPAASATAPAGEASLAANEPDLGRGSLAVLPFKNNVSDTTLAWLGSGLADLLTTNFAQIDRLTVVGRQSLYDLLTEEGQTEDEEIPESLATTVARAAGARMMVWGTISGTTDDLVIDAQLIELDGGTIVAGQRVRGSDVFDMVDQLTEQLMTELAGERSPTPRVALSRFGTDDLEALAAFQQGVAAERAGRPDEAEVLYEEASKMDSTFMLPVIRLAGSGDRWHPPPPAEGVSVVGEVERVNLDDIDWDEIEDWDQLDEEERMELRVAARQDPESQREFGRRQAEMHKRRALRLLENMGAEGLGEALVAQLEGMTGEEFIFKFDSTLSRTLSTVKVIVEETIPDSLEGR
jgi:TolB-like protein